MEFGFIIFAVFIQSHNIVVCSIQPGKPGTPAFWINVLTYLLFIMNLVVLFAMAPKKILPSTLSNEIGRNCSIFLESFSFGIWIPSANPQSSAINFSVKASKASFVELIWNAVNLWWAFSLSFSDEVFNFT